MTIFENQLPGNHHFFPDCGTNKFFQNNRYNILFLEIKVKKIKFNRNKKSYEEMRGLDLKKFESR